MAKIKMTIELDYDDDLMHGNDDDSIQWFFQDILKGDDLHLGDFGELGDIIGRVKVINITAISHT